MSVTYICCLTDSVCSILDPCSGCLHKSGDVRFSVQTRLQKLYSLKILCQSCFHTEKQEVDTRAADRHACVFAGTEYGALQGLACHKGLHAGRKQWLAELQVCLMWGRGHETTLLNGILQEGCPSGGKNSCQECRLASRPANATTPYDVMVCHRKEGWVCHRGRI